jgi:ATP-dependent helicase HepA
MYVLECVAPPGLHIDRFLPPAPIRVILDHRGREASRLPQDLAPASDDGSAGRTLLDRADVRENLLPKLLAHAERVAERAARDVIARARREMHTQLTAEAARLEALRHVNRTVRLEDVRQLTDQRASLDEHLAAARLRLDAVRVTSVTPAAG